MTLTPDLFDEVPSPFIADRIRETRWRDRKYIQDLLELRQFVEAHGPKNYMGAMVYGTLKKEYPVELRALEIELREQRQVSTEEYQQMCDDAQRRRAAEEAAQQQQDHSARQEEQRRLAELFTRWRQAGGQP